MLGRGFQNGVINPLEALINDVLPELGLRRIPRESRPAPPRVVVVWSSAIGEGEEDSLGVVEDRRLGENFREEKPNGDLGDGRAGVINDSATRSSEAVMDRNRESGSLYAWFGFTSDRVKFRIIGRGGHTRDSHGVERRFEDRSDIGYVSRCFEREWFRGGDIISLVLP